MPSPANLDNGLPDAEKEFIAVNNKRK